MRSFVNRLSAIFRAVLALIFLIAMSSGASAYTIVMLGGRQLQIPDQFTVTKASLTYNVGPTISATILMAAVDVSATERANHEAPGSLLRRAMDLSAAVPVTFAPRAPQRRSITNEDLKGYARARRASDAAYEKRRIELGLPSLEESRRKAAEDAESLAQLLAEKRAGEQQTRELWQASANELRTELAAIDAQIDFIRGRLSELPATAAIGSLVIANGPLSFAGRGRTGVFRGGNFGPRPNAFIAPLPRNQIGRPAGAIGQRTAGGPVAAPWRSRGLARPFSPRRAFGLLLPTYDFAYEGSSLEIELDRLLIVRAGLKANQRELEDEARRAGVDPGWLRR